MNLVARSQPLSKLVEAGASSRRLWLIFSARSVPIGKFSMSHIMNEFEGDKLFFNCRGNSWYLDDVPSIDRQIERALAAKSYDEVIALGSSMGGYGAALFGARHKAGKIVALAPNFLLGRRFTHSYFYVKAPDPHYSDLFGILAAAPSPQIHAFFGAYDPGDALTISDARWATLPNGRMSLLTCFHDAGGFMERRKILRPILHAIAEGRPYEVPAVRRASEREHGDCTLAYELTGRLYDDGLAPGLLREYAALNVQLRAGIDRRLIEQAANLRDFERARTFAEWKLAGAPDDVYARAALTRALKRLGPRRSLPRRLSGKLSAVAMRWASRAKLAR